MPKRRFVKLWLSLMALFFASSWIIAFLAMYKTIPAGVLGNYIVYAMYFALISYGFLLWARLRNAGHKKRVFGYCIAIFAVCIMYIAPLLSAVTPQLDIFTAAYFEELRLWNLSGADATFQPSFGAALKFSGLAVYGKLKGIWLPLLFLYLGTIDPKGPNDASDTLSAIRKKLSAFVPTQKRVAPT